ncbi:hypothetical protein Tdes44962_MAKER09146 [Teratosphaeria destructans]|uniref:Uncharacterized protein n=1 Tax=Teratosphaeria destructans TaxID=418781 RepID=A0A9W7SU62_9PEZI|nr:hypothetical protein Tdes44962_MAKER09146 [Teratosphaeria destructans]
MAMAAAHEESAVVMGQVPQSMEEGILRLESKLQRPLTTDELTRVSTMYQRIDGARASIFKGVCKGRVSPESAGGFESAINGCRAKAWTIVRQKILDAEARRLRTEMSVLEHDVRQAQELLGTMGKLKQVVGEVKVVENLPGRGFESVPTGDVMSCGSDEEGRGLDYEVRNCSVPLEETVRARPAKKARLI